LLLLLEEEEEPPKLVTPIKAAIKEKKQSVAKTRERKEADGGPIGGALRRRLVRDMHNNSSITEFIDRLNSDQIKLLTWDAKGSNECMY